MKKIIKPQQRYISEYWGWLKSYFLFSFAEYWDWDNMSWWKLRVFNDDFIRWNSWFPMHPHKDMEIITIMLDWTITHSDSMWNIQDIWVWEIQVTSAWTWIYHSEVNNQSNDLKLFQIWIEPNNSGLTPSYQFWKTELDNLKNDFKPIVSGQWLNDKYIINSDATIFVWKFEKWISYSMSFEENEYIFIYVVKWKIEINWDQLWELFQYRVVWQTKLNFNFSEDSDLILIKSTK